MQNGVFQRKKQLIENLPKEIKQVLLQFLLTDMRNRICQIRQGQFSNCKNDEAILAKHLRQYKEVKASRGRRLRLER
jgi:hypothetical protein